MIPGAFILFGLLGLAASLYIFIKKSRKEPLTCHIDKGCNVVVHSRYSRMFGVPNEAIGVLYYGGVTALGVLALAGVQLLSIPLFLLLFLGVAAGSALFSLVLIFIQAFVLKSWCEYCLISAGASFAIFLLAVAIAGTTFINIPMNNADALKHPLYEVATSQVNYVENAKGFLARPKEGGAYPGVVMVHEWWGLNEGMKDMAKELAAQGYVVLAADLYGGEVAEEPDRARALVASVNQEQAVANMQAAVSYLRYQENTPVVGTIGWCFGGGQSLQLAMTNEDIKAAVIYYGTPLVRDQKLASIRGAVLGIFGDQDQAIPVAQVEEFKQQLQTSNIAQEINIYPGVGHAFANPSGANYAPEATKDAWKKTLTFFAKYLKAPLE
ncbi:MAG: dienelactone hydrolase family protein [Parcubacteria group bacterium]|nr:dienelactone hydrolase family protein [Parcubacteria group bacterium]